MKITNENYSEVKEPVMNIILLYGSKKGNERLEPLLWESDLTACIYTRCRTN
jgi:hypothetical protein